MDIIFLEELRAETWIGIYPREKAMPQTVEISLQIGVSTSSAGHVATYVLETLAVHWVRVSVAKLGMMPGVKRVGVIIERSL